jgi:hypothetical protein
VRFTPIEQNHPPIENPGSAPVMPKLFSKLTSLYLTTRSVPEISGGNWLPTSVTSVARVSIKASTKMKTRLIEILQTDST